MRMKVGVMFWLCVRRWIFFNYAEYMLEIKDIENKDVDSSSLKEHFEKS